MTDVQSATPVPSDWPSPIQLQPFDAANAELLRNVAPANWVQPSPQSRYHLVIIGAGTAGLVSAVIASSLGAKVALVERHMFGGDCLNFGCVPSKALIRAARAWQETNTANANFGGPRAGAPGEFPRVMARLRQLRAQLSDVDSVHRFEKLGIDVFLGEAAFSASDAVTVGDATLQFRRAIIATGARAARPPIPGLSDTPYDTNESIFSWTELPKRLVVIGGGPIGAELAQSFARFGTQVTIVHADSHLLPREDADAAAVVARSLEREGVRIVNDARVEKVAHSDDAFAISIFAGGATSTVQADRLLVATGRTANVESLQLQKADIAVTKTGVMVNNRFRTSNSRVYAIGDVSSALQFTHVADAQARLAVANALFFGFGGGGNDALVVPRATYTSPEVAHVGMTLDEAKEQDIPIETVRVELSQNDRSVLDGDTEGFLKLHLRRGSDEILGATLVAAHAGDLIGEAAVAITNGVGLRKLGKTIHAYPTQSELYRKAADVWGRQRLTPRAKRLFAWWFRIFT